MEIYPWQTQQWLRLKSSNEQARLPHGLILHGRSGMGLNHFAHCLAAAVLSDGFTESGVAEQETRDMQLLETGNHPDLKVIEPEEDSSQIKVEQVRELIEFLQLTAQYGRKKIALVSPADRMNHNAANALLKTLEEPPGDSLLILITHRASALPVTIRSRCQQVDFNLEHATEIINWLQENYELDDSLETLLQLAGAPLKVAELHESGALQQRNALFEDLKSLLKRRQDPVTTAEKWLAQEPLLLTEQLISLIADMLRLKISPHPAKLQNLDFIQNLHPVIKRLDLLQLLSCYDASLSLKSGLESRISYNKQALLEEFILKWQQLELTSGGKSL